MHSKIFSLTALFCLLLLPPLFGGDQEKGKSLPDDSLKLYDMLVDTLDQVEENYVKEIDRRELFEAAIRGVMQRLDPYSSYISPRDMDRFRANVESEFGGIGIQITMDEDENLSILSPLFGTPAYRAGLAAGDRIVEINGKNPEGLSLDEVSDRLKGEIGTAIELTVIHAGDNRKESVKLVRERIHLESVLGDRRKEGGKWDFFLDPQDRIAYIRLASFSRDTAAELKKILEDLRGENVRGLIIDVRNNPGGLLNAAVEVCDLFIAEGRIVSTKGRNTPERVWEAKKEGDFEAMPMVVLINRYSASASEIVAACLQDHHRAILVGERTWGKGSVQSLIELEEGKSAIKLTTATYHRPSGKNIHRFPDAKETDEWGVHPDDGYEIKISTEEREKLLLDRRERDILRTTPSERTSEKTDDKTASPADTKKRSGVAENGVTKNGGSKNGDKKAKSDDTTPVVDRQLDAAVKYLHNELAKAK